MKPDAIQSPEGPDPSAVLSRRKRSGSDALPVAIDGEVYALSAAARNELRALVTASNAGGEQARYVETFDRGSFHLAVPCSRDTCTATRATEVRRDRPRPTRSCWLYL